MFDIFSVGDSAYLQAVLNAVAMIAGTGDYRTAAGVGGLIGVIIIMLRALMQWDGRGIRYQDLFLAYVLWLMLYAPSVKVSIEDAYTGTVVAVDNVPLGPAVVGSVMSNMGYRTTRLFEQAFAMPSMTGHGFADSLQTLTAVRKNLLSRVGLGAANVPNAGSDMETSFANYVRECTLTGVDLNLKSVDAILRDADPLNALRFDSDIYMTEIYVGGQPQTKTCTDAWTDLGVVANGAFSTALENLMQQTLGVQAAADTMPKIQDAFDALAGPGVINAADYMLNLFINMSAAGKMAALISANYNLPSIMGIYQLDMELQQWLSIGGMLAASTPAITLMLIYRGAVTATHFLGRMDGGDYVNEKIATPDVISPAPVLNAQPQHQYSPLSAVTLTGIQNDFKVGQDKADTIAADITQTVNDSQGYQAGLAKSLAMDAQSGTRNVASMGLQNQSLSSLQHSATDAISASESYQQTVSAQQRFGAQANFGAAETGLKLASDGALMERLDHTLDQYGLRGDAQRLASQWKAAGWIADSDQAYAAAGMSLLTGFSSPSYRTLDSQQPRSAEIAGYQLLGDAFHAPTADPGWNPGKSESLKTQAPAMGSVQSIIEHANLVDPRQEAERATHRAQSQINRTLGRVTTGEKAIEADHAQNLKALDQHSSEGFAGMGQIKAEHFRAAIASAANSTPSAAEFSYNMLGGSIYNTAKTIEAVGSVGNEHVKEFAAHVQNAYSEGAGFWDAVKFAASQSYSGFKQASETWADQRVNEVTDRLTPNQQAYYRAAMFEAFAGIAVVGDYGGSMGEARQRLLDEEGDADGDNIAKLLRGAAGQNRQDLIDQIGNFNRARGRVNY